MASKEKIQSKYSNYMNSFYDFSDEKVINSAELEAIQEYNEFLNKLEIFKSPHSIADAKETFQKIYPLKDEYTYLKIGNAKCVVIARQNLFRICLDNEKEYICYNFIEQQNTQEE